MIQTTTYVRKPLYVEAVQVTAENFNDLALWCEGEIQEILEKGRPVQFIAVKVSNPMNPRQSQARVGDWILNSDRGYKVYTHKAFEKAFDESGDPALVGKPQPVMENGYTAAELQELFDKRGTQSEDTLTAVVDEAIQAEEFSEATLPPAKRDPNVVYPDTPETTA